MNRDTIFEMNPKAYLLDGFDDAIVGMAERINLEPVVAYNINKIVEILTDQMVVDLSEDDFEGVLEDGLTVEEKKEQMAWEYFDYNIMGAWMGEGTPVFLTMEPK